jgi:hypothetical protein
MSKNDKEPDNLDRELDELNKEMEKEDEENRQVEQEAEPQRESIEDIEKRLQLENARHRQRLLNRLEDSLDEQEISESEQDYSGIPLSDLPSKLQTEFKNRVNEAVNNQLTEIDSQLKAIQSQLEADLLKHAQEAQLKIDERLQRALKLIDEHLTTGENTSFIKQFAQILASMETEPLKNVSWVIRLFATEDGIKAVWANATEAEK